MHIYLTYDITWSHGASVGLFKHALYVLLQCGNRWGYHPGKQYNICQEGHWVCNRYKTEIL